MNVLNYFPEVVLQDSEKKLRWLWILRIVLSHEHLFEKVFSQNKDGDYLDIDFVDCFCNENAIGQRHPSDPSIRRDMTKTLQLIETSLAEQQANLKIMDVFASAMQMSEVEHDVIVFAWLSTSSEEWRGLFRHLVKGNYDFLELMSTALDHPFNEVLDAVYKKPYIMNLSSHDYGYTYLKIKKELFDMFSSLGRGESPVDLLLTETISSSHLNLISFNHLQDDIKIMVDLLRKQDAQGKRKKNLNVLIQGQHQTGKTTFVQVMTKALKFKLFEVKSQINQEGSDLRYQLCQHILAHEEQAILLMDGGCIDFLSEQDLNESKVPTFWINSEIDKDLINHFDYVLCLPSLPRTARLKMVQTYLNHPKISKTLLHNLAKHQPIELLHLKRAQQVLDSNSSKEACLDDVLKTVINNSLKASSLPILPKTRPSMTTYDISLVNTDVNVPQMIQGLKRSQRANLCFYGVSGTGKTALAEHIAYSLGKPCIIKKTSDIVSKYIGDTERNIANMFQEASNDDAVLVLDEADSILRDRRFSRSSWETTQVNELLVQMEDFEGLFICCTNLIHTLDQALFRRFSIKMEFQWFTAKQAYEMLKQECIGEVSTAQKVALQKIPCLVPGDFSAVKKQLNLLGEQATTEMMIKKLREEAKFKNAKNLLDEQVRGKSEDKVVQLKNQSRIN